MENTAASNSRPRLAGLKVLVIDDSKTIRRTAETLLAREGCEVPRSPTTIRRSSSSTS